MIVNSYASKIEIPVNKIIFSKIFLDIHDCFNKNNFVECIDIPKYFDDFVNIVYDSFKVKRPRISNIALETSNTDNLADNKVLLGFSGGLDSVA